MYNEWIGIFQIFSRVFDRSRSFSSEVAPIVVAITFLQSFDIENNKAFVFLVHPPMRFFRLTIQTHFYAKIMVLWDTNERERASESASKLKPKSVSNANGISA